MVFREVLYKQNKKNILKSKIRNTNVTDLKYKIYNELPTVLKKLITNNYLLTVRRTSKNIHSSSKNIHSLRTL